MPPTISAPSSLTAVASSPWQQKLAVALKLKNYIKFFFLNINNLQK